MIKKFKLYTESSKELLSFEDTKFLELKELIEDCLIDCKVEIQPSISTDYLDDDDSSEFTTTVYFTIEFLLESGEYSCQFLEGNPYSNEEMINIKGSVESYIHSYENYINEYKKFINAIKSLVYRAEKSKYKINCLSIQENIVLIHFIVENEKIKQG